MKLSIIISNRNDVSMLAVTVRSCLEQLKPVRGKSEIIIADNSDPEIYKCLNSVLPAKYIKERKIKVFRQEFPSLFSARELAIKNASGEYIICLDSHMLVGHNMFKDMVDFMNRRKGDKTLGFGHAPINWAHQHERTSRHGRDMSVCELGNWGAAYKYEQKMTWKGMPWICKKDFWYKIGGYGVLAKKRMAWGGGDMFIGIKPWMLGYANWAIPCSPGIHIGPFPKVDGKNVSTYTKGMDKYRLYGKSGDGPTCMGFLVACYILGGEPMMNRNKAALQKRFGKFFGIAENWEKAKEMGKDDKVWMDKQKVISFENLLKTRPWDEIGRNSNAVARPGSR